jgi:hypothetical protein
MKATPEHRVRAKRSKHNRNRIREHRPSIGRTSNIEGSHSMSEIAVNAEFTSSADDVWRELADFGGIGDWAPGVESCKVEGSGIGAIRKIGMPGGVVMEERLESLDDAARCLTYAIVGGPMPLENYIAKIEVSEQAGGCRVDWGATFDAQEGIPVEGISKGVSGAYSGMLAALKSKLGEG